MRHKYNTLLASPFAHPLKPLVFVSFLLLCMYLRVAIYRAIRVFRSEKSRHRILKISSQVLPFHPYSGREHLLTAPLCFPCYKKAWPQESANVAPLPRPPPSFHVPHSHRIKADVLREHGTIAKITQGQPTEDFLANGIELSQWEVKAGAQTLCLASQPARGEQWPWRPTGIRSASAESTDTGLDTDRRSSGLWYASPGRRESSLFSFSENSSNRSAEESLQYEPQRARKVSRSCEISEGKWGTPFVRVINW